MEEKTGRAIIKYNSGILFIKRTKYNQDGSIKNIYYTLPGGHLEENENYKDAAVREVEEELGLKVKIISEFIHLYNNDLERDEVFFLADIIGGKLGTGNGPEFQNSDYIKYGKYEIEILDLKKIKEYNILPIEVKNKIIRDYKKVV